MKHCTKCGEDKPLDCFVKNRQTKDGLGYWCKQCRHEASRTYRETHVTDRREYNRTYQAANREYFNRHRREYYAKNRDKVRAKQQQYSAENPHIWQRSTLKYRLKTKYNLTVEQYNAMLEQQRGVCAICGKPPQGILCVDHDHTTGKVRGLLCDACNMGLGHFQDDASLIKRAGEYLDHWSKE